MDFGLLVTIIYASTYGLIFLVTSIVCAWKIRSKSPKATGPSADSLEASGSTKAQTTDTGIDMVVNASGNSSTTQDEEKYAEDALEDTSNKPGAREKEDEHAVPVMARYIWIFLRVLSLGLPTPAIT